MKNETTSHVATHFRCWSAVHFVCCCCFDKSPDRVTAWFQSMFRLNHVPCCWALFVSTRYNRWGPTSQYFSQWMIQALKGCLYLKVFCSLSGWTCSLRATAKCRKWYKSYRNVTWLVTWSTSAITFWLPKVMIKKRRGTVWGGGGQVYIAAGLKIHLSAP